MIQLFPLIRALLWSSATAPQPSAGKANLKRHVLGERTSTRDNVLAWVPAETGEPEWKDEHELEAAIRAGRVSPDEAVSIRAEGERVWAERPWPTGWEDWRALAGWTVPELPEGWDA